MSNIFWGCLKFLIFFWGDGLITGPCLRMKNNESTPLGVQYLDIYVFLVSRDVWVVLISRDLGVIVFRDLWIVLASRD